MASFPPTHACSDVLSCFSLFELWRMCGQETIFSQVTWAGVHLSAYTWNTRTCTMPPNSVRSLRSPWQARALLATRDVHSARAHAAVLARVGVTSASRLTSTR